MHRPRIIVLSPPFYSHLAPMMALARALADHDSDVIVGCSPDFEAAIRDHGLGFTEVRINRNANTGRAAATRQAESERQRLREFFEATYRGPVETLRTQTRHRFSDMLANPEELLQRIAELERELNPALWVADQLSYGVTLALIAHGLRFITFCPPHPLSIPGPDAVHGVPPRWPSGFSIEGGELAALEHEARRLEGAFTRRFNQLLTGSRRSVDNAFRCTSAELIIHNYPELESQRADARHGQTSALRQPAPHRLYCGYSFVPPPAETESGAWDMPDARGGDTNGGGDGALSSSQPSRIVVALGTFLSARDDVLIALGRTLRRLYPASVIAVGAGEHVDAVRAAVGEPAIVEAFIAQQQLLRDADLFVHHGGVSSFTEALYYSVPMIVLPFSSDQFNVAVDVERAALGAVLDPNELAPQLIHKAVERATAPRTRRALTELSNQVRSRGPAFAAQAVLELLAAPANAGRRSRS